MVLERLRSFLFTCSLTKSKVDGKDNTHKQEQRSSYLLVVRKNSTYVYFFLAISLILASVGAIARAQDAENTGKIQGKVTLLNETLANQTVSLKRLQNNTLIWISNATTDSKGNYTFAGLDVREKYQVSLVFQGVPYSKDVSFGNQTSIQIDFIVYATTTSDANMKIEWIDIVIVLEEGHLRIFENAIYGNTGLQVFNNSRLKAWLPPNRNSFKTSVMDCCIQQYEDNVLFDPMDPIKPNGNYSMWMDYNIPISSSDQQFEKKLAYNTEQFYLIVENKSGFRAEIIAGLANKPTIIEVDNVKYTLFTGIGLKADSTIIVKFTGLPAPQNYGPVFLWVLIPLIFGISFLTYPIVRKRSSEKKTPQNDLEAQKLTLFEAIAQLDSDYDAGKISKGKYEKLKSKHKNKAIEIMQQIEKSKVTQLTPPVSPASILTELQLEEQALISTLHKLDLDYDKGLVSVESYRKMKSKFEHRRAEVVKEIKKLEKTEKKDEASQGVDS